MTDCVTGTCVGKPGYARYTFGRGVPFLYAHRIEWERVHGEIPEGMQVHHVCGNRACINPDHLELLTAGEHRARHRSCTHTDRYVRADGRSRCRVCHNEWQRRRRVRVV